MLEMQLQTLQPGPLSGIFRIRHLELCETRQGTQYLRLTLEDFSGSVRAYAWTDAVIRSLYLPDYSLVWIEGQVRWFGNHLRIDLLKAQAVTDPPIEQSIRLLPHSLCPIPGLLQQLAGVVAQFHLPVLRTFVLRVLADNGLAFPFVCVPASLNHHHNQPGGLLLHSLECVWLLSRHREFRQTDYELGLAATLFHDIGKIQTMTADHQRTSLGASMDHDKLTLEVLAPHLKWLQAQWPEGGNTLRYLLTWKYSTSIPSYTIANLVACCDRISTGLDRDKAA